MFLAFYIASMLFYYIGMRMSISNDIKRGKSYPYMTSIGTIFTILIPFINALVGFIFFAVTLFEILSDRSKGNVVHKFFLIKKGDK